MSALDSVTYEAIIGDSRNSYRRSHVVQFFESPAEKISSVSRYIQNGINFGEGVIIIAAKTYLESLTKELLRLEVKVYEAIESKQLVMLDANETLKSFMIGNSPDWLRFQQNVTKLMKEMNSRFSLVRAYGEMVDILASQGNLDGAMLLEALWNELNRTQPFSLLCGYSTSNFKDDSDGVSASRVCSCHSHTVSPDRELALKLTR